MTFRRPQALFKVFTNRKFTGPYTVILNEHESIGLRMFRKHVFDCAVVVSAGSELWSTLCLGELLQCERNIGLTIDKEFGGGPAGGDETSEAMFQRFLAPRRCCYSDCPALHAPK